MSVHPVQTVTEMALLRADFYRRKSPSDIGRIMRESVEQGLDVKEITFWETRSSRFRLIVCELAEIPRTVAGQMWKNISEDNRQSIRVALRELKTVISDGMNWQRVEVQTRRGI